MTDANARPRPPDEEVVRTRRIEVLDDCDRIRVVIGQLAEPGTHEIRGFGITLRGPNGSVRADLIEDASGARLAFLSSGNNALEVGAEDANTLMLDRGGGDLTYLPVGSPGNEVMRAGPYIIFDDADGAQAFGWRVDPDGSVEPLGPDDEDAAERTGGAGGTGAAGGPSPLSADASERHCAETSEGCAVCVLAEHFLNTLVRAAAKGHCPSAITSPRRRRGVEHFLNAADPAATRSRSVSRAWRDAAPAIKDKELPQCPPRSSPRPSTPLRTPLASS